MYDILVTPSDITIHSNSPNYIELWCKKELRPVWSYEAFNNLVFFYYVDGEKITLRFKIESEFNHFVNGFCIFGLQHIMFHAVTTKDIYGL